MFSPSVFKNALGSLLVLAIVALSGCNLFSVPQKQSGEFGWGGGKADNPIHSGADITSTVAVYDGSGGRLDTTGTTIAFSGSSGPSFSSGPSAYLLAATAPGASGSARDIAVSPSFEAIGKIDPPTVDGRKVKATHVTFFNKKAYISYNTEGEPYGGAIDVVDISDPASPKLVQSLALPEVDVAATFAVVNGATNHLYVAGQMSRKKLSSIFTKYTVPESVPATAILERFVIKPDGTFDPGDKSAVITLLPGYVTTSVFQTSSPTKSYIFVTTGNDIIDYKVFAYEEAFARGGTFALSKDTFGVLDQDTYNYAMYLDIDNGNARHLTLEGSDGGNGILHVYKVGVGDASAHKMIDLGPMNTNDTKNTVDLYKNETAKWELGFVAMGSGGMKAYDVADAGLPISSVPLTREPAYAIPMGDPSVGVDPADWLCNSVASDGEYVYLAAGAGGLWVATIPASVPPAATETLKVWKSIDFSSSANFVCVDKVSGLVFVASGTEGTKIVSR